SQRDYCRDFTKAVYEPVMVIPTPAKSEQNPTEKVFMLGRMRDSSALQVICGGMTWLVERQISPAWELDRGKQPPSLGANRLRDRDPLGGQLCQRLLDVIAHQVELVLLQPICRMHGDLGWRELKDQPATSGVEPRKSEHVADEHSVGLRISTVENDM